MAVLRKRSKWPRKRISKHYENAWSKVYKNAWKKSTKTQWQTDLLLKTIAKDYHRDITFSFLWQNSSDNFGWTFTCSTGRRAVGKICTASFCTVSTCACSTTSTTVNVFRCAVCASVYCASPVFVTLLVCMVTSKFIIFMYSIKHRFPLLLYYFITIASPRSL